MKKIKYTCSECNEVNIVTIDEVFRMGMGESGVSATEIGGIDIMLDAHFDPFGGLAGFSSGGHYPSDVTHYCKKCNKKTILELP